MIVKEFFDKTLTDHFSAALASAQFATYSGSNARFQVNIPSDTASSGSGPIYFQISAPSGTSWVALGQGSRMSGSNMFVVYQRDSTNVTLSPRLGQGHVMPEHDTSAQVTLLDGSGVGSDGSITANVRCDNCNSWSGGSMSFTDSSSSWIYAAKSGSALNSDDVSESISQHDTDDSFSLDLTTATGGSSSNPFSASGSSASGTGSPSATSGSSSPSSTSSSNSGNSGSSASSYQGQGRDNTQTLMTAHGIIMTVLFIALFPLISLTIYLPYTNKVRYIHAPLQILSTILLIAGMSLGIVLGQRMHELDGYHMVIGFIVVASLVLFQPAMGIYQHMHYRRTGGHSAFGIAHRWLGRTMIILGVINGGLGWQMGGNQNAYVPYAVVAVIVFLIYISVLIFSWYTSSKSRDMQNEKGSSRGYEMSPPRDARHQRLPSDSNNQNASMYQQQRQNKNTAYTINSRYN